MRSSVRVERCIALENSGRERVSLAGVSSALGAQLSERGSFIFGLLHTTRLLRRQGETKTEKAKPDKKSALNHERIHSRTAASASEILCGNHYNYSTI